MANQTNDLVIIRGTTPLVVVTVPEEIDMERIADCSITIAQKSHGIMIIKGMDDVQKDDAHWQFSFFLHEDETLQLLEFKPASIQIKLKDNDDVIIASYVVPIEVAPVLDENQIAVNDPTGGGYGDVDGTGVEIAPGTLVIDADISIQQTIASGNVVHVDTTAHWNAQPELIGRKGHLYVYSDFTQENGEYIPAIKSGDGSAYLIDLPFVTTDLSKYNTHIANSSIHVQDGEREFWNNKVTCFMSQADPTTIVFTKGEGE